MPTACRICSNHEKGRLATPHAGSVDDSAGVPCIARIGAQPLLRTKVQITLDRQTQTMLRIEKEHRENFMFVAGQLGTQVFLNHCWRSEGCTALHLPLNDLARGLQNLVYRRRQIATLCVTHHQRGIKRGKGQLRHDRAPVARAELPGTVESTAQRKQSGGADGRQDASAHGARRP
ncbi:hypothetical protein BCEP4_730014 [Burkholderia cepacia]|nr:hypothetical protein BCEP4_730014 [Burkholderia cepacia]